MEVRWIENINIPESESGLILGEDIEVKRSGKVIGNTKSFWGTTYLTILCNDGKIREVSIKKAEVIDV